MFKARNKVISLIGTCLTMFLTVFLAFAMMFSVPQTTTAAAADGTLAATFTLGANGSASHNDGSEKSSYSETVNGYTLSITAGSKMYTGARDAKGNSCIKLGTSSATGGFSFTVTDEDITSVIIYVAKYKANTTKIKVNGTSYTLSKNSNDGAYDEITVDTSSTKTVTLTTVSGGVRAMVNTIEFYEEAENSGSSESSESTCEHANTTTTTTDATCTTDGSTVVTCDDCGVTSQEKISALGHNYVDGICSRCGKVEPNEETEVLEIAGTTGTLASDKSSITWSSRNITFTNQKGSTAIRTSDSDHYRVYANSTFTIATVDGSAITKIVITCTSDDYATVCKNSIVGTATVSGSTVTVTPADGAASVSATASAQWRLNKIEVTYEVANSEGVCEHTNATAGAITPPTCTDQGYTTYTCNDCGESYNDNYIDAVEHKYIVGTIKDASCAEKGEKTFTCDNCGDVYTENIPVLGHNYVDGVCSNCGAEQPVEATITFDDKAKRTAYSTEQQVWTENGIWVTNDKGTSTTDIIDFEASPVRFYKNSKITIEYPNMTKIVFYCNTKAYASDLSASFDGNNIAPTVTDNKVTVTFESSTNSFGITLTGGQVRIDSITVYAEVNKTKIDGANLTIGEELTLNYYVTLADDTYVGAVMYFTVEGISGAVDAVGAKESDGRYKYSLKLAPQFMNSNVKAELKLEENVITTKENYSVKEYAQNKLNEAKSTDVLKQLLVDMLYYGAAAQKHTGYNTENLATAGIEDLNASTAMPEESVFAIVNAELPEGVDSYGAYFTGAGVWFGNVNKIYVKLSTTENVTLTINEQEVAVTDLTVYTDAIKATGFADTYTFVLYYNGVEMQTLTYSVNTYANKMQANANVTMKDLSLALYRYGQSAEMYQDSEN